MIRWNVQPIAKRHHVPNAHRLAAYATLTLPVAYRVWANERLNRIDVATLEHLARAFNCAPWKLLEYRRE